MSELGNPQPPAGEAGKDDARPGVGEHPDFDATKLAEMLWAFADYIAEIKVPEGYYVAWAGRLRAASLLLTSLLRRAQNAEAGEGERLRERLLDFIFGEYDLLDRDHGWPVKRDEFEAAFDVPPSDSQGDQDD